VAALLVALVFDRERHPAQAAARLSDRDDGLKPIL